MTGGNRTDVVVELTDVDGLPDDESLEDVLGMLGAEVADLALENHGLKADCCYCDTREVDD